MNSNNAADYENHWQEIRLACHLGNFETAEMLEDYSNDRLYYLENSVIPLSLAESLKVRNHSPAGFNHGYGGSGPAQLALAICLQLYDQAVAEAVYQHFKSAYIATLPDQHKEFDIMLKVPVDPIAIWNIPLISKEESFLDDEEDSKYSTSIGKETIQPEHEKLQQEHDKYYYQAIRLPGSMRYEFIELNKSTSFCYLRIVGNYQGKVVVIATDPGDQCPGDHCSVSGSSITNAAETVATQVCKEFAISYDRLDWIGRYVKASSIYQYKKGHFWNFKETWDRVTFTEINGKLTNPSWKALQQKEIEHLKGIL